jgi:hypothetical protein
MKWYWWAILIGGGIFLLSRKAASSPPPSSPGIDFGYITNYEDCLKLEEKYRKLGYDWLADTMLKRCVEVFK